MSLIVSPRPSCRSPADEVEARAAELVDPDLERDARSRRGLLEDHPERAAGEEVVLLARLLSTLELVGQVEHLEQLVAAPVGDAGEGPPLQAVGDGAPFPPILRADPRARAAGERALRARRSS